MTLNSGANHVADNMGPSVGSKSPITANGFDRVELCHRVFGDAECSWLLRNAAAWVVTVPASSLSAALVFYELGAVCWAAVQFLIPATTDFNAAIT